MNGLHYSKAQRVRVAERDRLSVEIRNGWHLYDMMCECGSKQDADANLKPKINKRMQAVGFRVQQPCLQDRCWR